MSRERYFDNSPSMLLPQPFPRIQGMSISLFAALINLIKEKVLKKTLPRRKKYSGQREEE